MATLKDVAKLANCDISTVSRALNHSAPVHPETRARVIAAVKKLSYKPNLLAKGLKMGKRNLIALVVPSIRLNIFSDIAMEIQSEARKQGYETIVVCTKGDASAEKKGLENLSFGMVDGIIIAPTGLNTRLIRDIASDGIHVIQLIRKQDENISSVSSNYYDAGKESVRYLAKIGCTHIGLLHGNPNTKPFAERENGYKKVIRELHMTENIANSFSDSDYYSGYNGALQLLDKDPKLDGIIAITDLQGIGALRLLKEKNIACPDQVKVISLTGIALGEMLEKKMTSMKLPGKEIAQSAVRMLINEIENSEKQRKCLQHVVFNAFLIEGETT